jgi:hypothetical protein
MIPTEATQVVQCHPESTAVLPHAELVADVRATLAASELEPESLSIPARPGIASSQKTLSGNELLDHAVPAVPWTTTPDAGAPAEPDRILPSVAPDIGQQMPTALLARSPFEESETASVDLSDAPVTGAAELVDSIEPLSETAVGDPSALPTRASADATEPRSPANVTIAPTLPPDVAAVAEPFDHPQEEILSGAWELAVLRPPEEAARVTVEERVRPGPTPPKSDDSNPILAVEKELFAPSPIDSDAEIEQELFACLAALPATEIPPVPLVAEPSPAPRETKPMESLPVGPGALAEAPPMVVSAMTLPAGKAPPGMLPRPIARPSPRPPASDPLAAVKALTDAERIALFT